eukprot:SAG11_NODE_338_length_10535_cov_8.199885_9_plen_66_part_00
MLTGANANGCYPQVAAALGRPLKGDKLAAAMAEMDADGGGTVDAAEFEAWWLKCQAAEKRVSMPP